MGELQLMGRLLSPSFALQTGSDQFVPILDQLLLPARELPVPVNGFWLQLMDSLVSASSL